MKNYTEETIEDIVCKFLNNIDRKTIFFVGAGISIPSGLPNFSQFNKATIKAIAGKSLTEDDYSFLSNNIRPEVALQIMVEELGKESLYSLAAFEGYKPNPNHFFLAEALRRGHYVFTVNGDYLIEDACASRGINIENRVCISSEEYRRFNEDIIQQLRSPIDVPGGYLFKLHGSIEKNKNNMDKYSSFLVTLNEIGKAFDKNKADVLKYFVRNYNLVFMGYSCLDDFSIYPILLNTESNGTIFWFKFADGIINELISGKERLEITEKQSKEDKHVNIMLKQKSKFLKLIGNSSYFVNNRLLPPLDLGSCTYCSQAMDEDRKNKEYKHFEEFCRNVEEINLCFFLGRLWEECWYEDSSIKALEWFEKAESIAECRSLHRAKAKMNLARVHDKQHGARDKDICLKKYAEAFEIFEYNEAIAEACKAKIEFANFKRRALSDIIGAIEELQNPIFVDYINKIKDSKKEKDISVYAKYLNVLALAYMRSENEIFVEKCTDLFKESIRLKKEIGDVAEEAESLNSFGLFLQGKSGKDVGKLDEAIKLLTDSLIIRSAIGNFRGAAQNHRNLGLCYLSKMETALDKEEKNKYFKFAEKHYLDGLKSWMLITENPPLEEILELNFRLGEVYNKNRQFDDAISKLEYVKGKRTKTEDWDNRIRMQCLLLEAYYSKGDLERAIEEANEIYEKCSLDDTKIKLIKKNPNRIRNIIKMLEHCKELLAVEKEICSKLDGIIIELKGVV